MKKIEVVKQRDIKDCGPCCILSLLKYYNGYVPLEIIHNDCYTNISGTTAYNLVETLKKYGFDSYGVKVDKIDKELNLPAIAHLSLKNGLNHYVVCYKLSKNFITIMDPYKGIVKMKYQDFYEIFTGVVIVAYPKEDNIIKREETNIYKFISNIIKNNKKLFINIIITGFIITFLTILNSMYFKVCFNNLNNQNYLKPVAFLFLFLYLSKLIFEFISNYYKNYLIKDINYNLNKTFFEKFFNLPSKIVKNRSSGEIITRVLELNNLHEVISEVVISTIMNLFLAICSFIVLYFINSKLLMILWLFITSYLLIALITSKFIYRIIRRNIECNEKFNESISESCNAFESIKNNNLENHFIIKMQKNIINYLKSIFKINSSMNLINSFKNGVLDLMHYTLITFGFYLLFHDKITLVNFITFESVFVYLIDPIKSFMELIPKCNYLKASLEKNIEFMDNKEEKLELKEPFSNGDIIVKNVGFSYNNYTNIIDDVNLTIKKNSHVMIKGKSGIGKSTFCKLLNRTYELKKGTITIDNIDIFDYALATVRSNITYLSQNEFLFDDTIKNNIILNNEFNIKKFNEICRLCHLEELVYKKPLRYETFINKNFSNLSGGEKQRIILARALYKNSSILILDEALSEVNKDLEIDIITKLNLKFKNKTIIYVTHKDYEKYFDEVLEIGGANA